MAPRKSTKPPKAAASKSPKADKPKAEKPKAEKPAAKASPPPRVFNTPIDEENRTLFLTHHLPKIKQLREKVATATSNLRNAYKTAKAEGSFTKADFDTAIAIEDAEKEAKTKAKIARQLVIARYMGKALGGQLDLFLEPDRTPSSDLAFEEGKQAALENKPAKPDYDPSTEQYRRYMEGYHSVSEARIKDGIKKKEEKPDAMAEDGAMRDAEAKQKAANEAQRAADASEFEKAPATLQEQTSGVPTSRAQFLAQQQKEKETYTAKAGDSEFSRRN